MTKTLDPTPIWTEIVNEYRKEDKMPELGAPPTITDALNYMPREVVAQADIVIFDGYLVKDRPGNTSVNPGVGIGRARAWKQSHIKNVADLIYDEPIHG